MRAEAEGKNNKEIAQALKVTERTVEFHMSNLLVKLGLSARGQVAAWVQEHRWWG